MGEEDSVHFSRFISLSRVEVPVDGVLQVEVLTNLLEKDFVCMVAQGNMVAGMVVQGNMVAVCGTPRLSRLLAGELQPLFDTNKDLFEQPTIQEPFFHFQDSRTSG